MIAEDFKVGDLVIWQPKYHVAEVRAIVIKVDAGRVAVEDEDLIMWCNPMNLKHDWTKKLDLI